MENCVNCNIRLNRTRRHMLATVEENVMNNIRHWCYFRDIKPSDYICQACWQLASFESSSNNPARQVGHQHTCIVCGRSTLKIAHHKVLFEGANEEKQNMAIIISRWIQPRELSPDAESCQICWNRARRAVRRGELQDETCLVCRVDLDNALRPEPTTLNQDSILQIISGWTENEQIPSVDQVCLSCWEQAEQQQNAQYNENSNDVDYESDDDYNLLLNNDGDFNENDNIEHADHYDADDDNNEIINDVDDFHENDDVVEAGDVHMEEGNVLADQVNEQLIILPNIRRAAENTARCIFMECQHGQERRVIPEETRRLVLVNYNYFIPTNARICTHHLNNAEYDTLYDADYSLNRFKSKHIEEIIFMLTEGLKNISFENIQNYPDNLVRFFIGITKFQHQQILNETPRLSNMRRGSFALTVLLCKMRTGESGNRLSLLFNVPRRTLETLMAIARKIICEDFVPQHLGLSHLSRQQVVERNLLIPEGLFGEPEAPPEQRPAIVIADATYLYTQKSTNYMFQKETYSLHKYRNLIKPFVICCCNGYIIDVRGPYTAITNDASIMRDILNHDQEFNNFFNEGDVFILDRGFRDSMDTLHDKGYLGFMPETKADDHPQLTTLEANRSRCVTLTRWVIEAVNGHFKRDFKIFRHESFNRACPNLMIYFKIGAALLNAFSTPFTNSLNAEAFLQRVNDRIFMNNTIAEIVAANNLNRRVAMFEYIDGSAMTFPRVSMQDLLLFACGTYQIRQARSYVGEHFRFYGIYTLEVSQVHVPGLEGVNPKLIRARIKSRHVSSRTYFVFIVVEENMDGLEAILSYCCNCIIGLRTVGCCSHVMSIIWYLGYARHQGIPAQPAAFLDTLLLRCVEDIDN